MFMGAGGGHALLTLVDTVRPTWFTPIDDSVRPVMQAPASGSGACSPVTEDKPSIWTFWLGFNVSHGLGAFTFGLLCVLIGSYDFELVERIDAFQLVTIAVSAAYFAIALRYWFWVVRILTGVATVCFTVAAVL